MLFFFNASSASIINFSVSFGMIFSVTGLLSEDTTFKSKSPLETLSPTFTEIDSISPEIVEGISTLDLSLSMVTIGSLTFIWSPCLTNNSITSTFSKSPISGTNNFSLILFYQLIH